MKYDFLIPDIASVEPRLYKTWNTIQNLAVGVGIGYMSLELGEPLYTDSKELVSYSTLVMATGGNMLAMSFRWAFYVRFGASNAYVIKKGGLEGLTNVAGTLAVGVFSKREEIATFADQLSKYFK